jgi:peptidoglycan/LPS O-acetylase OafA/YrhL
MPLMFVTVTIGGLYCIFVDPLMPVGAMTPGSGPLSPLKLVAGYIGFSMQPNQPIWSIYVELLGSMFLPVFVLAGRNRRTLIFTGAFLAFIGSFHLSLQHDWNIFMLDFFAGLSVLWWGRGFAERLLRQNIFVFWATLGVLFAVFYLPRELWNSEFHDPRRNFVETAAMAPFIAIAFFCPKRFCWLEACPFRFLGDVSFSLYLTHWILVTVAANLLLFLVPSVAMRPSVAALAMTATAMIAVTVPICLAIASLSYRFIEQPGQSLGRSFGVYLRNRWS